jgi:uncharacterized protein YjbI with pentapeptide repeats
MANPEHLEILRQGVEQWNKWRKEPSGAWPDLHQAKLGGARLSGVNFSWVDLNDADLSVADLSRANLYRADLTRADLSDAKLSEANIYGAKLLVANLIGANLKSADLKVANLGQAELNKASLAGADLGGADLTGANLSEANLNGANLRKANLGGATLRYADLGAANFRETDLTCTELTGAFAIDTSFTDVDLSVAKGLQSVRHRGPSTVSIETIYKSHGKIPEVFLRGCGVPDNFIEYMHSLAGQAFEFYSCFISYSTHDQEFAERLHADLQAKGVRCWFAPHDVQGGRKLIEQIDEAIRLHDKLLLILSKDSMSSNWVKTEIANAREREKREGKQLLFPITLVPFEAIKQWKLFDADIGIDSAREIREYFIPDFSNWKKHDSYQTAFQRLVKDLKAGAGG